MTNLLLMGLRTYLSKQNDGEPDISVRNYVSRRVSASTARPAARASTASPCRTVMPADTSFIEGVRQIAAVQNQVYRHTDFDTLEADRLRRERWCAPADALYESIALTYQPFPMRMQDDHLNQIEYRSIWHDNGTAVQPLYLTVMHRPLGTGMDFYFKYQAAWYSPGGSRKLLLLPDAHSVCRGRGSGDHHWRAHPHGLTLLCPTAKNRLPAYKPAGGLCFLYPLDRLRVFRTGTRIKQRPLDAPVERLLTHQLHNACPPQHGHGGRGQPANRHVHAPFRGSSPEWPVGFARRIHPPSAPRAWTAAVYRSRHAVGQLLEHADVGEQQRTSDVSDHRVAVPARSAPDRRFSGGTYPPARS